jgi:hypothetical protein
MLFIRYVKQEQPDTEFEIYTGETEYLLSTPEEIDLFGQEICSLAYEAPGAPFPASFTEEGDGAVFVFSTRYDTNLGTCINALSGRTVFLFAVAGPDTESTKTRDIVLSDSSKSVQFPGYWIARHDRGNYREHFPVPRDGRAFIEHLKVRVL